MSECSSSVVSLAHVCFVEHCSTNIFSIFVGSSLKELLPMFNECCNTILDGLRPLADGKREVEMKEAFYMVALDSISKVHVML